MVYITIQQKLDLSCNNITDDGAVVISDYLKHNSTLKKLNLSRNHISSRGFKKLSECIKHAIPLEYVDLSRNKSSPWGVYCVIIRYCCVNSLTLCEDEGIEKYINEVKDNLQANSTLQSLVLCKIGRIRVQLIKDIIGNITLKELSWKSKGTKFSGKKSADSEFNITVFSFETINLSNEGINDDEVYLITVGLYNNRIVRKLDLSCNNIGEVGAAIISSCLKHNKTLKELNLSENKINSVGMSYFCKCVKYIPSLHYIDLNGNRSSPWCVYYAIIKFCCVSSLTVCGDKGMEENVEDIIYGLQSNTVLQSLTLCKIGRIGLDSIKKVLDNNTTLKELNLSWKNKGTKIIHSKLTYNKFSSTTLCSDSHERVVDINILYDGYHECSSEAINMSNKDINDDAVCLIAFGLYNNTAVQKLDLSCNNITDDGAVVICSFLTYNNKLLKELNLSENYISFRGMNALSQCIESGLPLLEYVDLSGNKSSPWIVYSTVIKYCNVGSLTLCGDEGMENYGKQMVDSLLRTRILQSLTLYKIGISVIESAIVYSASIKELNLSWEINVKARKIFNRQLELSNSRVIDVNILSGAYHKCSSKTINLSHTNINDDAVYLITFGLHSHIMILEKLDLSHNNITFIGMNELSKCVKHTIFLKHIDLSGNKSSPWSVYCIVIKHCCVNSLTLCGDEGMKDYVKEITDSLQTNAKLQSLTLCGIGRIGVQVTEGILVDYTSLKEANLSWESDSKGTKILQRQLELSNNGILDVNILCNSHHEYSSKSINLSNKNIDDDAVALIAFGLYNNTIIEKMDLSNNKLSVNSMNKLSDYIKHTISLDYVGKKLSKYVKHTVSLDYVDLSGNESSPWGVYCTLIRHCCTTGLTLCGDEGMEEYVKEIIDSLQTNATLQSLTLCKIGRIGVQSFVNIITDNEILMKLNLSWGSNPKGTKILGRLLNCNNDKVVHINILYDGYHDYLSETINLSDKTVNDDAVHLISFGLYNNPTVKKLNLSHNAITDYGAADISNCLKHNNSLKEIKLSGNYIGSRGMCSLAEGIKHTISPKYVDLSGNKSSPWGVYCTLIRHCCVNSLTLCGHEGMAHYVKEITDSLHTNTAIQSLTLYSSRSNVGRHEDITKQPHLVIDGKLFCGMRVNNSEEILLGSHNRLVNIKVLYVDDCKSVPESISLSNRNISDDTACLITFGLHNNTTVKKLDCSSSNISMSGMNRFLECITHPIPLEYVDLSGNKSSPWGMYCAIIRHCCVNSLTLCGCKGMKHYVKKIINSLKGNATLRLLKLHQSIMGRYKDRFIKASNMKGPQNIIVIDGILVFNTLVNDDEKIPFKGDKRLVNVKMWYDGDFECSSETINLSDKDIDDDTMCLMTFGLYNNTTVKKIDLSNNKIAMSGMNKILECVKHAIPLEYVDLSGNKSSPWGVYCAIIRYCCVNSLTLCGDEGMKYYVKKITDSLQANMTLQSLNLHKIGRNGLHSIKSVLDNNTIVKKLTVSWKSKKIMQKSNSTRLCVSIHEGVVNVNILYDDCSSEAIDNSDNAVFLMIFGLYKNTKIRELDLSRTYITDDEAVAITDCFKNNCSLHTLTLSGNKICSTGARNITELIQVNEVIQRLDMSHNNICDDGAIAISECLKTNNTLQQLNLAANGITSTGAKRIAEVIGCNKGLLKIDISRNAIHDDGVMYITDSLKCNGTLLEVNLSKCKVTNKGANFIAEAIQVNVVLQKLNLSYNNISDDGMIVISNCLKENNALKEINLSNTDVSEEGLKFITQVMHSGKQQKFHIINYIVISYVSN